jgi:hypothetical protein
MYVYLEVIMEEIPRNRNKIGGMVHIDLTIVEVRPVGQVAEEFVVVDPYVGGAGDSNTVIARDLRSSDEAVAERSSKRESPC